MKHKYSGAFLLISLSCLCGRAVFSQTQDQELYIAPYTAPETSSVTQCQNEEYVLIEELTRKIKLLEIERADLAQKPKLLNVPEIGVGSTYEEGRQLRYLEAKVKELQDQNKKLQERLDQSADGEGSVDMLLDPPTEAVAVIEEDPTRALSKDEVAYLHALEVKLEKIEHENEVLKAEKINPKADQKAVDCAPVAVQDEASRPLSKDETEYLYALERRLEVLELENETLKANQVH